MSAGGLILAAGEGSRFGGPKALATTNGRTWLEIAVASLVAGGCRPIVVVVGAGGGQARAAVSRHRTGGTPVGSDRLPDCAADASDPPPSVQPGPEIIWVENEDWRDGRTGSLQCGLRALPAEIVATVVHAVDHPEVRSETVAALIAAAAAGPLPIVLPAHRGRRGHPILLARAVWPEVLALAPDASLRAVIHARPERVEVVAVDDPGILRNRNEPEIQDQPDAIRAGDGGSRPAPPIGER